MIPNDHAIMMYKIGEMRWIQKILEGELSLSCAGAFIHQAKKTGNYIQGDLSEAVFARLLNSNPKIEEVKNKLGNDLEIVSDGDYSFLRRKTAKLKPIFCAFAYTAGDALKDNIELSTGEHRLKFEFDERMYKGFTQNIKLNVIAETHRFTNLFLQSKPFVENIKRALYLEHIPYQMRKISYINMSEGEFFIEPTNNYDELHYKSSQYEYQHEARICLTGEKFSNIFERYCLRLFPMLKNDYFIIHSELYVEFTAIIENEEDEWKGGC